MTVGPEPTCGGGATRIPSILHKVWLGSACMQRREFVSTVSAALLLRPAQIFYHHSTPLPASGCEAPHFRNDRLGRGAKIDVRGCYRGLGVTELRYNQSDPAHEFARAARGFAVMQSPQSDRANTMVSDLFRLWALNTMGGMYIDADAFVLRPGFYTRWRSCLFVLNVDRVMRPGPPPDYLSKDKHGSYTFNNGVMLASPGTQFGQAWWEHLRQHRGEWSGENIRCCEWPARHERANPLQLHGATTMGVFPFRVNRSVAWESAATWTRHLEGMAAAGHESAHLYNWRVRLATGQIAAVERWALENAVRLRGGKKALSAAEVKCYTEATAWLDLMGGDELPAPCRGRMASGTCRALRGLLR